MFPFVVSLSLVAMSLIAVAMLPLLLRNRIQLYDKLNEWWPFGEELLRGYIRSIPVAVPASVAASMFLVATTAADAGIIPNEWTTAVKSVVTPVILLSLIGIITVILLNRPKTIVPPHLRSQPGALAAWYTAARRTICGRK